MTRYRPVRRRQTNICTAVEEQLHDLGVSELLGHLRSPSTGEVDGRRRLLPELAVIVVNVQDVVRGVDVGAVRKQQPYQRHVAEPSCPDKRRGKIWSCERGSPIVWDVGTADTFCKVVRDEGLGSVWLLEVGEDVVREQGGHDRDVLPFDCVAKRPRRRDSVGLWQEHVDQLLVPFLDCLDESRPFPRVRGKVGIRTVFQQ